jgi:tetratricopeptide (TPR) repeat protein
MALKLNADNEIFHNIAADIYKELGDVYAMKQHLLKSIALDPINHEPWVKLILNYLHQGDFEQCNALLEEALLNTYHSQLELLQAAIWIEMDQRFLAFEILNQIAEEDVKAINPIYNFLPKLINDSDLKTLVQVFQTI